MVAGGQDDQIVIEDLSARLRTSYLLKTNDTEPAYIAIKTEGELVDRRIFGRGEVGERLQWD